MSNEEPEKEIYLSQSEIILILRTLTSFCSHDLDIIQAQHKVIVKLQKGLE